MATLLRTILRRLGTVKTTIVLTLLSIILSVGISWGIHTLLNDNPLDGDRFIIAILAPAIITPIFALQALWLLSHLDEAEQQLQILSNTDELTQIYNRRYFMQYGERELKRAQRYGETFSIAIMDLDNFKAINDGYGHLAGDQVLRVISRLCRDSIRQADVSARYGGDEFIFLFPQTDKSQAQTCIERILEAVTTTSTKVEGADIWLSTSIGAAVFGEHISRLDDLLKRADEALYKAKKNWGNQYVIF